MMMKTRSAGPRGTWPLLRRGRFCSRWSSAYYARRRSRDGPRTARASKAGPRRPLKYRPRRRPRNGTRAGLTRAASCKNASSCPSASRRRRRGPWTRSLGIRRQTRGAPGPVPSCRCRRTLATVLAAIHLKRIAAKRCSYTFSKVRAQRGKIPEMFRYVIHFSI